MCSNVSWIVFFSFRSRKNQDATTLITDRSQLAQLFAADFIEVMKRTNKAFFFLLCSFEDIYHITCCHYAFVFCFYFERLFKTRIFCFNLDFEIKEKVILWKMSANNTTSATALAEQNPEDTYEQYEKYLHAGRSESLE